MLIALITIMFLGGASTGVLDYIADTRDNIKQVMPKGDEQKAALATLKAMKKRSSARNKQAKRAAKALDKTYADHAARGAEADAIWAELFTEIGHYNNDMLDLRFELKEQISREDWEEIFSEE
jgi:hypothetical protein